MKKNGPSKNIDTRCKTELYSKQKLPVYPLVLQADAEDSPKTCARCPLRELRKHTFLFGLDPRRDSPLSKKHSLFLKLAEETLGALAGVQNTEPETFETLRTLTAAAIDRKNPSLEDRARVIRAIRGALAPDNMPIGNPEKECQHCLSAEESACTEFATALAMQEKIEDLKKAAKEVNRRWQMVRMGDLSAGQKRLKRKIERWFALSLEDGIP